MKKQPFSIKRRLCKYLSDKSLKVTIGHATLLTSHMKLRLQYYAALGGKYGENKIDSDKIGFIAEHAELFYV